MSSSWAVAIEPYDNPGASNCLALTIGMKLFAVGTDPNDGAWSYATDSSGNVGYFPSNCIQLVKNGVEFDTPVKDVLSDSNHGRVFGVPRDGGGGGQSVDWPPVRGDIRPAHRTMPSPFFASLR